MVEDDYELLPHEELEHLREEIRDLKRNPLSGFRKSDDLIESIDRLNHSIHSMMHMFKQADAEMYEEYHGKYHNTNEKVDGILDQNKKIAKGMVALSKIMKEDEELDEETLDIVKPGVIITPTPDTTPQPAAPPPITPPNLQTQAPPHIPENIHPHANMPPPNFPPPTHNDLPPLDVSEIPKPLPSMPSAAPKTLPPLGKELPAHDKKKGFSLFGKK